MKDLLLLYYISLAFAIRRSFSVCRFLSSSRRVSNGAGKPGFSMTIADRSSFCRVVYHLPFVTDGELRHWKPTSYSSRFLAVGFALLIHLAREIFNAHFFKTYFFSTLSAFDIENDLFIERGISIDWYIISPPRILRKQRRSIFVWSVKVPIIVPIETLRPSIERFRSTRGVPRWSTHLAEQSCLHHGNVNLKREIVCVSSLAINSRNTSPWEISWGNIT